jgi:polyhydroxybutyrate depolymerase
MRLSLISVLALCSCAPQHAVLGRAYELVTPKSWDGTTPLPLVIMVHGYGVTGQLQDRFFPLSAEVDARSFIYALPNGTVDRFGKRFWNATDACCNFERQAVDDVAFFRALVDDISRSTKVREGQVFLVGHSNGAFMSMRLACDASDLITGVVAVAGSTFLDPTRCGTDGLPVPILLAHGDQDTAVPIEGRPESFPSARETGLRFGARNGCTGAWKDTERLDLLGNSESETQRSIIEGCPKSAAVELWTHEKTGHLPFYDRRWTSKIFDWLLEHAR